MRKCFRVARGPQPPKTANFLGGALEDVGGVISLRGREEPFVHCRLDVEMSAVGFFVPNVDVHLGGSQADRVAEAASNGDVEDRH